MPETEILSTINNTVERFSIQKLIDCNIFDLSGGEKQKIFCAAVDVAQPDIILLDEPTSGLDYEHMLLTGEIFRELKKSGKTVIIVTYDDEFIRNCCDVVLHLNQKTG